jgi:hypothetical protein
MMQRTMTVLTLTALLSACGPATPPPSLSDKLEGRSPEEKLEVLRLACLNEAGYSTDIMKAQYRRRYGSQRAHLMEDTEETSHFKTLCNEMTDNYVREHGYATR